MRQSYSRIGAIGLLAAVAFAPAVSAAAFTIDGVDDTEVYADRVSFRVNTTAGYDYTIELDGQPAPADELVEVGRPDYHELFIEAVDQGTAARTSETVRFIVRDRARGSSDGITERM